MGIGTSKLQQENETLSARLTHMQEAFTRALRELEAQKQSLESVPRSELWQANAQLSSELTTSRSTIKVLEDRLNTLQDAERTASNHAHASALEAQRAAASVASLTQEIARLRQDQTSIQQNLSTALAEERQKMTTLSDHTAAELGAERKRVEALETRQKDLLQQIEVLQKLQGAAVETTQNLTHAKTLGAVTETTTLLKSLTITAEKTLQHLTENQAETRAMREALQDQIAASQSVLLEQLQEAQTRISSVSGISEFLLSVRAPLREHFLAHSEPLATRFQALLTMLEGSNVSLETPVSELAQTVQTYYATASTDKKTMLHEIFALQDISQRAQLETEISTYITEHQATCAGIALLRTDSVLSDTEIRDALNLGPNATFHDIIERIHRLLARERSPTLYTQNQKEILYAAFMSNLARACGGPFPTDLNGFVACVRTLQENTNSKSQDQKTRTLKIQDESAVSSTPPALRTSYAARRPTTGNNTEETRKRAASAPPRSPVLDHEPPTDRTALHLENTAGDPPITARATTSPETREIDPPHGPQVRAARL